ncbi:GH3 family domain-containing protein [Salinarimonas sp. NSM]|uniref:GH3 family domain-containing protein n=1 Tax=Salinarimonas sp. NSM TaxID=3458003 RepID=UPI004036B84E
MLDATPLLRLWAARRRRVLDGQDAVAAQDRTLRALVSRAAETRFGRAHGFSQIRSAEDFRARVPVRGYEELWSGWWQESFPVHEGVTWPGRMPFFALSSGTTTGRTKYIPVSTEMVAANRRAALDILVHHLARRPGSRVLAGKSFMLGGSTALEPLAPGVRAGDLSGIAAATVPAFARLRTFPPQRLALEADWERKMAALAPAALAQDIRAVSGTPTWLLAFFETLAASHPARGERLAAYWPRLELVIHGGVAFAPYAARFARLVEGSDIRLQEVYPASEGFFAIQDGPPEAGLRLIVDNGVFYELVRPDTLGTAAPERLGLAEAEIGVDYALVVSTNAGLWAYEVGDLVRLVSKDPPRIVFAGRTAFTLSAFGEHLTGAEIDRAVTEVVARAGLGLVEVSAGARHRAAGAAHDHHLFVIELVAGAPPHEDARALRDALDAALARANADYASHRDAGQLAAPELICAPRGTFEAWMRARGKLGGQNKPPRVIGDAALLASLEREAEAGTRVPSGR